MKWVFFWSVGRLALTKVRFKFKVIGIYTRTSCMIVTMMIFACQSIIHTTHTHIYIHANMVFIMGLAMGILHL